MISISFFHERLITMPTNNKNLHLTDQDKFIIKKGIENDSTKVAIALTLGKDKSTIVWFRYFRSGFLIYKETWGKFAPLHLITKRWETPRYFKILLFVYKHYFTIKSIFFNNLYHFLNLFLVILSPFYTNKTIF